MTAFSNLRPNGFASTFEGGPWYPYDRSGGTWSRGAALSGGGDVWPRWDEDVTTSAADGDTGCAPDGGLNGTSTGWQVRLQNMASDFQSMDAGLTVRYSTVDFGGYSDDSGSLAMRIETETGGTILAALDSGGTYRLLGNFNGSSWTFGQPAYNLTASFPYVNTTATKSQWDDAIAAFQWVDSRNMASDNAVIVLVDFELEGDYTPTAPAGRFNRNVRPRGNLINATYY